MWYIADLITIENACHQETGKLCSNLDDRKKCFQIAVKNFTKRSIPGEFQEFGGPRGAAIHNMRIFLQKAVPELKTAWLTAVPELINN